MAIVRPIIQGHRGFRARWPENTIAGFAAALQAGVDAIELDVGLTRDGVVVVCHDAALDPDLTRSADGQWIAPPGPLLIETTLEDVRRYDVGRARPQGRTARLFPHQCAVDGAQVPTLAEVFSAAIGSSAWIDVEIKTDPAAPHATAQPEPMVEAVVAIAQAAGAMSRLALRAFDWRALRHAARCWPEVPLTWLSDAETEANSRLWWNIAGGCVPQCLHGLARAGDTWAPDHHGLTPERIANAHAHAHGLRVIPWTVNRPEDLDRLIACGADGICTDDPAMAIEHINRAVR